MVTSSISWINYCVANILMTLMLNVTLRKLSQGFRTYGTPAKNGK